MDPDTKFSPSQLQDSHEAMSLDYLLNIPIDQVCSLRKFALIGKGVKIHPALSWL